MRRLVCAAVVAWVMAGAGMAQVAVDGGMLKEGTRLTFRATFGTAGEVTVATGVGNEAVSLNVAPDAREVTWGYKTPTGTRNEFTGKITVGGREKPALGWTDSILEWSDHYNRIQAEHPLSGRTFALALERHAGFCRLLVNGLLMHEWPVGGDWAPSFKVGAAGGAKLAGEPVAVAMAAARGDARPPDGLFWPMDLSARYNAKGFAGEAFAADALPARDVPFEVGAVPFVIGSSAMAGNDHLDIGQSWFREGNLFGTYEEPQNGSFGGRWMGVHSDNPTRLQFRLPNRAPSAIHLLAATDAREHTVPRLTVQFYRVAAGFPVDIVSPEVPLATAAPSDTKLYAKGVKTASGKELNLWLVTVPVNPGLLSQLSCYDDPERKYWRLNQLTQRDMLEVEFTKDTATYKEYPDPCHYSSHGAGLPSAVRLFAATVEYPPVDVRFEPDAYGNVWTEPAVPSYTVTLTNRTDQEVSVTLHSSYKNYPREVSPIIRNHSEVFHSVTLKPFEAKSQKVSMKVEMYGHHDVTLKIGIGEKKEAATFTRSLAYLRQRELEARPFDARGFMFGWWNWSGQHATPDADEELLLMGPLGMASVATQTMKWSEKGLADAERFGIRSFWASRDHLPCRWIGELTERLKDPEKMKGEVRDKTVKLLEERKGNPKVYDPTYVTFFGEPGGLGTHGTHPEFYGEPPHVLTAKERAHFELARRGVLETVQVLHDIKPDIKILLPWGDLCFAIPFLKENDELTQILDGSGVDFGFFDRLPEMQFHQSALHRCYQYKVAWDKYKPGVKPLLLTPEGPCVNRPDPGSITPRGFADSTVRAALMLAGYGVTRQFAMCSPVESSDQWGEQHYGGGAFTRIPELNPHICYSAMATLIRHLRWMEFVGWKKTGSNTVFCHHYRDSKTSKDLFVLWTVRGTREVTMTLPQGAAIELYDPMDNIVPLTAANGTVTFTVDQSPIFLYGPSDATTVTLGAPDHSDAVASAHTKTLGLASDLLHQDTSPKLVEFHYLNSFPEAIRRFPAEMSVEKVPVPNFVALSVTLPPQPKDRGVMPFFSTFVPDAPIEIPGKASHLSLWVRAASDWGRVVYVLRDAKGEGWISVGSIGEWNCDDMPCDSYFNFDGWRLVRFEMPSHAPYDRYREPGSLCWGSLGDGDGIVDLPLKLEKVYVERRANVMHVNTLEPADPSPVLLGELIAEYATADDMGDAAIALDRLQMPPPREGFIRSNPFLDLEAKGELPPTRITAIEHPSFEPNGLRGVFSFDEVPGAASYDIWVGTSPDGSGALLVGKGIKRTATEVRGTRPNADLYAFILYTAADGKTSKPSPAFKFKLDSQFGNR
ncbi:MAG: hypothetical protein FWG50_09910 [Kiritimatiellaeota bacterium]|nr:hypothetical protein [Kiritimatiellota bacterium]